YDLKQKALMRLGRPEEAIEAGKAGLRLSPQSTHLAIDIATLLIETKHYDEAQKHAELALKSDPGRAHALLTRMWIDRKDLVKAEKEARLAVDSGRDQVSGLMALARVKIEQGQIEEALAALDRAASLKKPDVSGFHF